jgi:hypothetical protein
MDYCSTRRLICGMMKADDNISVLCGMIFEFVYHRRRGS